MTVPDPLTDAQRAALEPWLARPTADGETPEFRAASIVHIAETFLDVDEVPSEEAVLAELRSRTPG